MADETKEYLSFFDTIRDNPIPLKSGTVPSVLFNTWENSYKLIWFIVSIFTLVFLCLITSVIVALGDLIGPIYIPLIFALWVYVGMKAFVFCQREYFLCKGKNTSSERLWKYNLAFIAQWPALSPILSDSFKERYPKISPVFPVIPVPDKRKLHHSKNDFVLFVGKSTGLMSELWHGSSLAGGQNVMLNIEDASKNILALGGIGSGKTSGIMQPLLLQLLHQGCGGLIFDIKGDVKSTALSLAKLTNRHIRILGPSQSNFNLSGSLAPEIISSMLKSSLLLSNGHLLDGFWVDTAAELSRNLLGVLSFIPKYYTLLDLYKYIFDRDAQNFIEKKLQTARKSLTPEQKRLFDSYHKYKKSVFDSFDEKVKNGVKATLAQTLAPFTHPEFSDAFCSDGDIKIEEILNGTVFLVDLPIAKWGLGAKVAYTFIKLRFYNLMQKHHNAELRKLPVFFMCDEFQEIVTCNKDGLSDLNFWDKSRSSKTIGIISAQSVASVFAATGNRDYTYALLQNFRNKLCLASEDPLTIEYISSLTGQAKTQKKSVSAGSQAVSETISEVRDPVIEAQVFRSLSQDSALAFLTIDNFSSDDVLKLYPIFDISRKTA